MKNSIVTKSSELEVHRRLVQLISEESDLIANAVRGKEVDRHTQILDFLIELQSISSRSLK